MTTTSEQQDARYAIAKALPRADRERLHAQGLYVDPREKASCDCGVCSPK